MLDLFKNIIRKSKKEKLEFSSEPSTPHLEPQLNSPSSVSPSASQLQFSSATSSNPPPIDPQFKKYYTELSSRYRLIEKIGEGAFSHVFKALDTSNNTIIAIKIINKSNMKIEQINSVLKEISIMNRLNHPNIIKLLSYQNSKAYCFLFLEYLSGGEIFNQIIKYTYFSENLSRHIIKQVCLAVKYLHDNGVVHRDIKPENLLFNPIELRPRQINEQLIHRRKSDDLNKIDEGEFIPNLGSAGIGIVKLADFGLSTILYDEDMKAKTPCGTVGYTSPEQHLNQGYNKKVDIWAIGCVLYTLVVGFPPFYSNNQDSKDISIKVSRGDYKFLSPWFDEVSDDCKKLISNLLTVDPEKRYDIDQLLRDPWMNSFEEVTTKDKPFDKDLYNKLNSMSSENLLDTVISSHITTPRAEAIRLVFDTGNDMQREQTPPISTNNNSIVSKILRGDDPTSTSGLSKRSNNLDIVEENETIEVLTFSNSKYKRHHNIFSSDEETSEEEDNNDDDDDDDDDDDEEEDTLMSNKDEDYKVLSFSKLSQSPNYKNRKLLNSPPPTAGFSPSDSLHKANLNHPSAFPIQISNNLPTSTSASAHNDMSATTSTIPSAVSSIQTSNSCTSSIMTSEIEDYATGSRRKSSVSFHLNGSGQKANSRSGSMTSSITNHFNTGHKCSRSSSILSSLSNGLLKSNPTTLLNMVNHNDTHVNEEVSQMLTDITAANNDDNYSHSNGTSQPWGTNTSNKRNSYEIDDDYEDDHDTDNIDYTVNKFNGKMNADDSIEDDETDYDRTPSDNNNNNTQSGHKNQQRSNDAETPTARPIIMKKYNIENDESSTVKEELFSISNKFDLKLNESTLLSRRKLNGGSIGIGSKKIANTAI